MNKSFKISLILTIMLLMATPLFANVFTLVPSPSANLWNLSHNSYYTWGINWDQNISVNKIYDMKLTFHNVWDWIEEDDFLYTHLLDNAPLGAVEGIDREDGDYFESSNYTGTESFMGVWSDPVGGVATGFDLTYSLRDLGLMDNVRSYIANDGNFGFGFDADCHYFNEGVSLEISTIPEPTTLVLFGLGLVGIRAYSKRRK